MLAPCLNKKSTFPKRPFIPATKARVNSYLSSKSISGKDDLSNLRTFAFFFVGCKVWKSSVFIINGAVYKRGVDSPKLVEELISILVKDYGVRLCVWIHRHQSHVIFGQTAAAYIIWVAEIFLTGEPLLKRKVSSVGDNMRERFQCVDKVVLVVDFSRIFKMSNRRSMVRGSKDETSISYTASADLNFSLDPKALLK